MRSHRKICVFLGTLIVCAVALGSVSQAAMISYPDQGPVGGFTFTNIEESSATDPVPLYGAPTPFVAGLDFNPTTFASSATNGDADITDGQLNFTIMNASGTSAVEVFEAGDFSFFGAGTNLTTAGAGAILRATVTQINGINVAPIVLTPVNASVAFNMADDPGLVQPWSLGLALDVAGQLGPGQNATKIDIAINNTLATTSEAGTISFIAKKEFIVTTIPVPEPASVMLVGMALCGLGLVVGRGRG